MSETALTLTPQQLQVVGAIANGLTFTAAAEQAGVHRNTVANWRAGSPLFAENLLQARHDKAIAFRERTEALVDLACQTLQDILNDPKASASAKLKAAIYILDKAATPPGGQMQPAEAVQRPAASRERPVIASRKPETVQTMHNSAQQPYQRDQPKVGRNDRCPCGSGAKHKYCCLNEPSRLTARGRSKVAG